MSDQLGHEFPDNFQTAPAQQYDIPVNDQRASLPPDQADYVEIDGASGPGIGVILMISILFGFSAGVGAFYLIPLLTGNPVVFNRQLTKNTNTLESKLETLSKQTDSLNVKLDTLTTQFNTRSTKHATEIKTLDETLTALNMQINGGNNVIPNTTKDLTVSESLHKRMGFGIIEGEKFLASQIDRISAESRYYLVAYAIFDNLMSDSKLHKAYGFEYVSVRELNPGATIRYPALLKEKDAPKTIAVKYTKPGKAFGTLQKNMVIEIHYTLDQYFSLGMNWGTITGKDLTTQVRMHIATMLKMFTISTDLPIHLVIIVDNIENTFTAGRQELLYPSSAVSPNRR